MWIRFNELIDKFQVKGNDFAETSALLVESRKPETAFQRYRNSRLGGDFHSEINGRSLGECLDECLRQNSFQCHSAVYSERFRICRLSRYNQRDGHRVIYDGDYDYYENLISEFRYNSTVSFQYQGFSTYTTFHRQRRYTSTAIPTDRISRSSIRLSKTTKRSHYKT